METPEEIAQRFRDEFVYTSDAGFQEAIAAAIRDAYERAAVVCDELTAWNEHDYAAAAAAIRKLKGSTE